MSYRETGRERLPYGLKKDMHPEVARIWYTRDDDIEPEPALLDEGAPGYEPMTCAEMRVFVRQLLEFAGRTLTKRELAIVGMRCYHDVTLEEAAAAFKLTRERIRQIEKRAVRKLRGRLGVLNIYASLHR